MNQFLNNRLIYFRCDVVYGTPTMFIDILGADPSKFDTSSLKRGSINCFQVVIQLIILNVKQRFYDR